MDASEVSQEEINFYDDADISCQEMVSAHESSTHADALKKDQLLEAEKIKAVTNTGKLTVPTKKGIHKASFCDTLVATCCKDCADYDPRDDKHTIVTPITKIRKRHV